MALGFKITFQDKENFLFEDLSNASDYSGLSTLKTRLEVIYPLIDVNTAQVLNLFDENISTLTDNYTFNETIDSIASLIDGVYQFDLVLYDDAGATNEVGRVTELFIQDYDIQTCIKNQVESAIASGKKDWCEIDRLSAMLDSAKYCASQGQQAQAEDIIAAIQEECIKLNCTC